MLKKQLIELKYKLGIYDKAKYLKKLEKFSYNAYKKDSDDYKTLKAYVDYITSSNHDRKSKFVNITEKKYVFSEDDPKIISFYLPQYYEEECNNKFHGKGFTEWTNATRCMPSFTGHEQPHLPYDVGFYSLLNVSSFRRQIELAKMYGIFGFCFHYYWFSGKRTMEKPIQLYLDNSELDFPFCFNWATENWTALWDGGNNELIFDQTLHKGDDQKFIEDILPYFKDERYIKIDGKPLLMIYNPRIFGQEQFKKLIASFRYQIKKAGFPDLYIILTNHGEFDENVYDWNADALSEFAPTGVAVKSYQPQGYVNPYYRGRLHYISDFLNANKHLKQYRSQTVFRCAMPHWDNSPRKAFGKGCGIFQGTPEVFKRWMKDIIYEAKRKYNADKRFIFINSWNEWAESCHLEPDLRYGYAYLQMVKDAIEETRKGKEYYILCIESLGDIIACEPIVRYIKKLDKDAKVNWIVEKKYREAIAFNPNINNIIKVDCLSDADIICNNLKMSSLNIIIDCHYDGRRCRKTGHIHHNSVLSGINEENYFNYGSLLEVFSLIAGLDKIADAPIFYLQNGICIPENLPQKYIVIHTTSSEKRKDWTDKAWNKLVKFLIKKDFYVVEVGLESRITVKHDKFKNCTNIHSIQVIAKIIQNAHLFIGVDSAFAHIANALGVYGILLFGKYKNFDFVQPYTGNYQKLSGVTFIYRKHDILMTLPFRYVKKTVAGVLSNNSYFMNKKFFY